MGGSDLVWAVGTASLRSKRLVAAAANGIASEKKSPISPKFIVKMPLSENASTQSGVYIACNGWRQK
jgi:hypothetical protein